MSIDFSIPVEEYQSERRRLQALAEQAAADARERSDTERKAGLPAGSLRDIDIPEGPDDDEIIDLVAATFNLNRSDAVERLAAIDFARARELVAA